MTYFALSLPDTHRTVERDAAQDDIAQSLDRLEGSPIENAESPDRLEESPIENAEFDAINFLMSLPEGMYSVRHSLGE